MSLFGKTVVVGGLTKDTQACFVALAEAAAERFRENEAKIEELRAELERLKAGPRQSLAQKIKARGLA